MRVLKCLLLCLLIGTTSLAWSENAPVVYPQTLLQIAGVKSEPLRLSESVLLIIDAQREYVDGKLPLAGMHDSLREAAAVLERARKAGTPVIHIVHHGKPGAALFNPAERYVDIVGALVPQAGEPVIVKTLPDAFAGTSLEEALARTGRKSLVVIGYMTHMCVSSTVRAALARGYRTAVVAGATATRDLPDNAGGVVRADEVQRASLAALADRFAVVIAGAAEMRE